MSGHTPGPWKTNADGMRTVMGRDGNGELKPLAQVFVQDFGPDERFANARLIAAAPEMAGVLKGCLDYFAARSGLQAKAFEEDIRAVLETAGVSAELPSFEDVRGILGKPEEED